MAKVYNKIHKGLHEWEEADCALTGLQNSSQVLISAWGSIGNSGRHNTSCVCRGTSRHFEKALINFCACTLTIGLEILLDTYYISTYLNLRLKWHDQCLSIASTKGDDRFSDMGGLSVTLAEVQFLSNLPFYKYCVAILSCVHQDLVCVVWGND